MSFLSAVLEKDASELQKLIAQHDPAGGPDPKTQSTAADAAAPAATVTTCWQSQLTGAPPCQNYQSLKTVASFQDDEMWNASSAGELKELCKKRSESRKPLTELNQACNIGFRELKKAMASYDQRVKAKAEGMKGSKKTVAAVAALWEKGLEIAKSVPQILGDAAAASMDVSLPCLIKLTETQQQLLGTETWLQLQRCAECAV